VNIRLQLSTEIDLVSSLRQVSYCCCSNEIWTVFEHVIFWVFWLF